MDQESNTSLRQTESPQLPPLDLNTLFTQLSNHMAVISQQNLEIKKEMTQQNIDLENKITEKISEKITQQNKEIEDKISKQMSEQKEAICSRLAVHLVEQNEQLERIRTDVANTNTQMRNAVVELQHRIDSIEQGQNNKITEMSEEIRVTKAEVKRTLERNQRENVVQMEEIKHQLLQEQKEFTVEAKGILYEQNTKIEECRRQLEIVELNASGGQANSVTPPEIVVNIPTMTDNNIIKFSGRSSDPVGYLNKLKKLYQRQVRNSRRTEFEKMEILHETIELSFESYASRWWTLIKHDVTSWEEFETLFLSKYWDQGKQRLMLRRMESEKYIPHGRQTRSEYIEGKIVMLKAMSNNYTDEDIIEKLVDHFDEIIQSAVKVQNIRTISDFEDLLHKADMCDETQEIKKQISRQENVQSSGFRRTTPPPRPEKFNRNNNTFSKSHNQYSHKSPYSQPYNHNYRQNNYSNTRQRNEYVTSNNYNGQFASNKSPPRNFRTNQPSSPANRFQGGNFRRYPSREQINVCQAIANRTDEPIRAPPPSPPAQAHKPSTN